MLAVVLVGGEGTRLRPLTYQTPKQILPLVGVPMIECVLAQLSRHGVTDAVLWRWATCPTSSPRPTPTT